ncbi:ATP-binding protein [Sulfurisphaera ohwakuensis]|uniref:ATP-binding protein n=1 Tax=Sulfurisphaera ohwakuensis TaxID=69656 RepID=UPI0036F2916B
MKCSKCDNKAIIKIPYSNLALCKDHFIEWFEKRFERIVDKYKMFENSKKIAVAVSGGKDSTTLLHLMKKLSEKKGFEIIGINIDLGIDMGKQYSSKSTEFALKNFEMLSVKYRIVRIKERYGFTIDDAKHKIKRPVCSTCGLVKRYTLTEVAEEEGADTIVTGHNLNDMAQFIMAGYFNGDVRDLARLDIITPPEKGYRVMKVKPLFLIYEKEILTYALVKGIPFLYDSCPHTFRVGGVTQDTIRRKLEELEEAIPGYMLMLVENFINKIQPALKEKYIKEEEIGHCKICGRPTTKDREICSFCAVRLKMTGQTINIK